MNAYIQYRDTWLSHPRTAIPYVSLSIIIIVVLIEFLECYKFIPFSIFPLFIVDIMRLKSAVILLVVIFLLLLPFDTLRDSYFVSRQSNFVHNNNSIE